MAAAEPTHTPPQAAAQAAPQGGTASPTTCIDGLVPDTGRALGRRALGARDRSSGVCQAGRQAGREVGRQAGRRWTRGQG